MTEEYYEKQHMNQGAQETSLSIVDWIIIYITMMLLVNGLVATQLYPSQWLASFLPGGANEVNLLFVHEILQAAIMIGGVLFFLRFRGKTVLHIGWRLAEKPYIYILAMIFGVLSCWLMILLSAVLTQIFPQWATTQNVIETTLQVDSAWGLIASFLSVGIMAPLCEEVLFRGYLYHAAAERFGTAASICITSLLFAVVHGQWFQLLPLFAAGVCLNLFYVRTKSLIATVIMHSAWNSFSLFFVVGLNFVV